VLAGYLYIFGKFSIQILCPALYKPCFSSTGWQKTMEANAQNYDLRMLKTMEIL
jgi:hypothetical protein